ncbi:MAG: cadmium-translocating P-type ATPase [Clostridia bacterium]|nr:cadmium-translocating P-type ATPase [Clostridia bacterium]
MAHEHEHAHCGCDCGCGHDHKEKAAVLEYLVLGLSLVGLVLSFFKLVPYIDPAWIAILLCGKDIFIGAFKAIRQKKITSSLLVSVAILASVALEIFCLLGFAGGHHGESYLFAAGEIAFLMCLGEFLEEKTVKKSKSGVQKLAKLLPHTAKAMRDGEWTEIAVSKLHIGDVILVNPEETVPADGVVIKGESAVDNSHMTGESVHADVAKGDFVYGGARNVYGVLEVQITQKCEDMALSRMIRLTEEAQGKKAPIARTADRWASVLVPVAALIAVLIFLTAYFVLQVSLIDALVRGVSVLVVFCPCALTLATPTAISASFGAFSKQGVLAKSGGAVEALADTKYVAFDKTGTLTKGMLAVTDIKLLTVEEETFFSLLKTAESISEHPIAKAILKDERGSVLPCEQQAVHRGMGVSCVIDGKAVKAMRAKADADAVVQTWQQQGKTVITLTVDNETIGLCALADTLRAEAKNTATALKGMQIEPVMLTGDNGGTAEFIANQAGISKVEHSLMPEKKTEIVSFLKDIGKTVYVGDGINDTPALATADVGISMSVLGSDIATQNADICLFTEDLTVLPWLIQSAKRVLFTIKTNIIFAMTVNVIAVILSFLGYLSPVGGALLHNGVSVLVVLNSCRLLNMKK